MLVLGSLAGRVDHGVGMLSEMRREQNRHPSLRLWLVGEKSVSWLLAGKTRNVITFSDKAYFTPNVGILPLFGRVSLSTKGLEWDVTEWESEMGENVSTSNHVVAEEIEIYVDRPVLFTVERT